VRAAGQTATSVMGAALDGGGPWFRWCASAAPHQKPHGAFFRPSNGQRCCARTRRIEIACNRFVKIPSENQVLSGQSYPNTTARQRESATDRAVWVMDRFAACFHHERCPCNLDRRVGLGAHLFRSGLRIYVLCRGRPGIVRRAAKERAHLRPGSIPLRQLGTTKALFGIAVRNRSESLSAFAGIRTCRFRLIADSHPSAAMKRCASCTSPVIGSMIGTVSPAQSTNSLSPRWGA
jgi:hypothetical protein